MSVKFEFNQILLEFKMLLKLMTFSPDEDIMMDEYPMIVVLDAENLKMKTKLVIRQASLYLNERYKMKKKPRYMQEMQMNSQEYREFVGQLDVFIEQMREKIQELVLNETYLEKIFDMNFGHRVEFTDKAMHFIL